INLNASVLLVKLSCRLNNQAIIIMSVIDPARSHLLRRQCNCPPRSSFEIIHAGSITRYLHRAGYRNGHQGVRAHPYLWESPFGNLGGHELERLQGDAARHAASGLTSAIRRGGGECLEAISKLPEPPDHIMPWQG